MPRRPVVRVHRAASHGASRRAWPVAALGLAAAIALTACTAPEPGPTPTATRTSTPSPSATPTPTAPALVPDGSANDNLPFFASIVSAVWAGPDRVSGRAYIDALVAGGFDKTAMQVTPDVTTVGNPAETIQFSVLWGQDCLVGQVGPATGEPVAVVLPALAEGGCLVGKTRPIDW